MKHLLVNTLYILLTFSWLCSCTYHNEEELYGNKEIDPCDTITVTYTLDVQPVLQANCYSCHNQSFASGGINLDGFNQTKSVAHSGRLVGAINHSPGFSPMPKSGGKLASCDITKIGRWVEAGMPQN